MTEHKKIDCCEIATQFYSIENCQLIVGESPIGALAERFGTPAYVYDESVLETRLAELNAAFGSGFSIFYSMKANPDSRVVRFFAERCAGIEVASAGELNRAIDAGCVPNRIVFAGPGKTPSEIRLAIQTGIGEIHAESLIEVQRIDEIARDFGRTMPICIRVNPAEMQGGAMRMGGLAVQFGIDEEQLDSAIDAISKLRHVTLQGVHLFAGTQILDAGQLLMQYERSVSIADQVASKLSAPLKSIDFGGGLGVPYFAHESELDLKTLGDGLTGIVQQVRSNPRLSSARLIIEPGRFLTADAGIYVTRVLDIKTSRGKKFVIVDGGLNHHLAATGNFGQVIKRNFPVACINRLDESDGQREIVDIVGPLCTPLDRLARDIEFPMVEIGDLIGVFRSGAYGRSASPQGFLSHEPPGEIYVANGSASCIRIRQVED